MGMFQAMAEATIYLLWDWILFLNGVAIAAVLIDLISGYLRQVPTDD
jgi:hypothetical protein